MSLFCLFFFLSIKKTINAVLRPACCTISASFNRYSLNADSSYLCKLNSCKLLCNVKNDKIHSNLIVLSVPTSIGVHASVLIDCGSTTNFISKRFVKLNQISTVNTASSQVVRLADGSVTTTCKLVQSLHMYINNRDLCEALLVFPIDSYDIILGMPWLKKHNPTINWNTNTLLFPTSPLKNLLKANSLFNSTIHSSLSQVTSITNSLSSSSFSNSHFSSPSKIKSFSSSSSRAPVSGSCLGSDTTATSPIQICHISVC